MQPLFDSHDAATEYLIERGVIPDPRNVPCGCLGCDAYCVWKDWRKVVIRCERGYPECSWQRSVYAGTFFANTRLGVNRVLRIAYYWLLNGCVRIPRPLLENFAERTVRRYMYYFRQLVDEYPEPEMTVLADQTIADIQYREPLDPMLQLGGPGLEVQVDESKFARRLYNRGRAVGQDITWVVGGIDQNGTWYASPVIRRNTETLRNWIEAVVAPGSVIVTDEWRGYRFLGDHPDYTHFTVNHSENFVDPETGRHTQRIEGKWGGLKKQIPQRCRGVNILPSYLNAINWMQRNSNDDIWEAFMTRLAEAQY